MKKNLVFEAAEALVAQMKIVQKCNDTDLDAEMKRMETLAEGGKAVASMAESQAKMFIATGTLPANNLLFSEDEKIITRQIENIPVKKSKGLLIEEFTKTKPQANA